MATEQFDFINHCKSCNRDTTHCCTKEGNIVLIRNSEKDQLKNEFQTLINKGILNNHIDDLKFDQVEGDVFEMNFIDGIKGYDDENQPILGEVCPFYKEPIFLLHSRNAKPIDCKLWPIASYDDSGIENIKIDSACSAFKAKEIIPLTEVNKAIDLIKQLSNEEKGVYLEFNKKHYDNNNQFRERLLDVPIKYWEKFQKINQEYKRRHIKLLTNLKKKKDYISNWANVKDYNSEAIISATKWVLGVSFILCLGSIFRSIVDFDSNENLIYEEFSRLTQGKGIWPAVLKYSWMAVFLLVFLTDFYRMIIPLPWVIKKFNMKKPPKYRDDKNLARTEVHKLVVIGFLTIFALNILALGYLFKPEVYLGIFGFVAFVDHFWYKISLSSLFERLIFGGDRFSYRLRGKIRRAKKQVKRSYLLLNIYIFVVTKKIVIERLFKIFNINQLISNLTFNSFLNAQNKQTKDKLLARISC